MRNWKTTLAGLGILANLLVGIFLNHKPVDQSSITQAIAGVGLLVSKDYDKTGTAAEPVKSYSGQ